LIRSRGCGPSSRPHDRRFVEALQQVCGIAVNRHAACAEEIRFGKPAAQHADRRKASFRRALCIVRGIADGDRLAGAHAAKPLERRLEHIGVRLGTLDIVGSGFLGNQILDARDSFVGFDLVSPSRSGERDSPSRTENALDKIADGGERLQAQQVAALEQVAAMPFQILADPRQIIGRHEHRHQLVAAFPDLGTHVLVADVIAEIGERFLPGASVRVH